jgi:hypothetical protein
MGTKPQQVSCPASADDKPRRFTEVTATLFFLVLRLPPMAYNDYSRDQRAAEWGSMVILHSNNPKPPVSHLGQ